MLFFLFQLFLLHPQKGGGIKRGAQNTLNHRHEEYTLQGQPFFDHSLALSAKKTQRKVHSECAEQAVKLCQQRREKISPYLHENAFNISANTKWQVDLVPAEQDNPALLHNVQSPYTKESSSTVVFLFYLFNVMVNGQIRLFSINS